MYASERAPDHPGGAARAELGAVVAVVPAELAVDPDVEGGAGGGGSGHAGEIAGRDLTPVLFLERVRVGLSRRLVALARARRIPAVGGEGDGLAQDRAGDGA